VKITNRTITLVLCILVGIFLGSILQVALATTGAPDYDVVLPGQDAPAATGRPAPYGQFIITHNGATITSTESLGTVARTNGYAFDKVIFCQNSGSYDITAKLYARIMSDGDVYTLTTSLPTFTAGTRKAISITQSAPWMSLGLTSQVTGTTATCGIYVWTP